MSGDIQPCACCAQPLGSAARRRHREQYLERVRQRFAENPDPNPNPEPNTSASQANVPPIPNEPNIVTIGQLAEEYHNGAQDFPTLGDVVMHKLSPTPPPFLPSALVQGLRCNPPVTIEEWPDIDTDASSVASDIEDIPASAPDRDPEFIEQEGPPQLNPVDEPLIEDKEMRRLLELEYGDIEDDEWIDLYTRIISPKDRNVLRLLATRLRTHFSRQTYNDLRYGVCEELDLPSEFVAWRRLRILSGLESCAYDCCEARYQLNGTARRVFRYTPLIPQLRALFQDAEMAKKLNYRVEAEQKREPNKIFDVFDAEHYCSLRETVLNPDTGYHFFDNPQDIALGLSTDGFTLFKRRRRGHSTAWPLILINYNLHARIRNRLENVICVGVIPGPKQCKDLNSFLVPLLYELLELESGVDCPAPPTPDREGHNFVFRAFLIMILGDIPAVAKLLMMKGHNALKPCRTCMIEGVICYLEHNSVYYVPMADPHDENIVLTYNDLQLRTHQSFLDQLDEIESARTKTARGKLATKYGLNARSIFTQLRSIDLATCAPYDAMHLLFENLVPNMIKHWTGQFKGLGQGTGNYEIDPREWAGVGLKTVGIRRTVPSAFVSVMHDIAQDGNLFTAELYAFWIQYVAPVVLKDVLPQEYYK
ncbi:Type III restriction-modification system EcoP15I enzyme mod [Rhizoctonia solani]|uniref:Type III restriction-modification system EcoP15I enzyme mod n=1 Tax=Rhizoctonia solani TaxID=456999 RepID=A0A0K6G2U2_9AGAM|nr:Type III restriction-modification system EcoP15I enzyme mod [Rhizoctonia solani]